MKQDVFLPVSIVTGTTFLLLCVCHHQFGAIQNTVDHTTSIMRELLVGSCTPTANFTNQGTETA
jgi:Na+/glutamate symporter